LRLRIISLLLVLIVLFTCGIANAERIKGKGASELYRSIGFETQGNKIVTCDNGLIVEFTGLRVYDDIDDSLNLEKNGSNIYWYKGGLFGFQHVLGVQGVYLNLTNSTDKLMVVKWSESSLNLGSFSGIPFLSGMKYKDAGNPSATPDTIIPANKTVSILLYISNITFNDGNWNQGYEYVRVDKSLKASIYMKVLAPNGASTYAVAESSAIIIPEAALEAVSEKKK
jgi:hypothetical protein